MIYAKLKLRLRRLLERTSFGLRLVLRKYDGAGGPFGQPNAPWANAVLRSPKEVEEAVAQVRRLGLPVMSERSKNWDSLAALDLILRTVPKNGRVFDAGGELYSVILPWLFLYGYENLRAGNLVFIHPLKRGPIVYEYADLTKTEFPDATFDAITCLSVIEHGVELESYFKEMSRLLKPGGLLVTSADYFETPVDTKGLMAYGVPVHIFTKEEILAAVAIARRHGFILTGDLDLHSEERVVWWEKTDLRFTFVIFSLRKSG